MCVFMAFYHDDYSAISVAGTSTMEWLVRIRIEIQNINTNVLCYNFPSDSPSLSLSFCFSAAHIKYFRFVVGLWNAALIHEIYKTENGTRLLMFAFQWLYARVPSQRSKETKWNLCYDYELFYFANEPKWIPCINSVDCRMCFAGFVPSQPWFGTRIRNSELHFVMLNFIGFNFVDATWTLTVG